VTSFRIGYTCHNAFPSTDTNTQQIVWTTAEVARLGHSVDLVVPVLRGGPDTRQSIARHYGMPEGLPDRLRFVALGDSGGTSHLSRAWFDLRASRQFNRRTHDVVWTRDPLAFAVALQWRVPVVFETYRPDFATALSFAPWRTATIGHSRRIARLGGRRLLGVIAHSKLTADAFIRAGVPAERVLVAHNGFAPSLMTPVLSRRDARLALGLPLDVPLVVYAGHVGPEKGTDALVSLAARVPEVRMVIVGASVEGSEQQWVHKQAERAGAHNVQVVPRVDLREVALYLYAADCLVIPPTDAPLTRYGRTVLPMKVFPYLAAGRPILGAATPDVEEVLTNGRTAMLVPPGDTAAAASALRTVLTDTALAASLASAAAEHARQYTWDGRARRITRALGEWLQA